MIQTFSIRFPKVKTHTLQQIVLAGLFIGAFSCMIFFNKSHLLNWLILVMVSTGLAWSYNSKRRTDPLRYFDKVLVISGTNITLGDDKYELEQVHNLKFEINEYDGQERIVGGSDRIILNGTGNKISFTYSNQHIETNFYLASEFQMDEFKSLFEYWYRNKVKFYEGDKGGKTYLLEKLAYKEIQEFKRTHSLD